jgi:signal transduction histidine kinase
MSIVNEIVSLHDGEIDIESAPRRGTRVTLWLQLAAQEVAPAA